MRGLSLSLVLVAVTATDAWGARETGSIAPEIPLPTPYGLKLVRSIDYRHEQAAAPEPQPEPLSRQRLAQYETLLEEHEGDGAYAPQLAEVLRELAAAYRSRGDYAAAIDAYKRAVHVTRVNEGLYTAVQIPLLRQLIETHLGAGDLPRADQMQQYLYLVTKLQAGQSDRQLLEAALAYSDWQRKAYLDGLGGDTYLRLLEMHTVHTQEVQRLEAQNAVSPALIPHLYRLLGTEYLLSQYEGEKPREFQVNLRQGDGLDLESGTIEEARFKRLEDNIHRRGRKLLQRILALERQKSQTTTIELVEAKVALGDWYLWSERRARAQQSYAEAFALLADMNDAAEQRQRLFGAPVELPASAVFRPGREFSAATPRGHATMSFTVSRYGRAKNIEVLELNPQDSAGARIAIVKMLRQLRFRPRMEAGVTVGTERVVREYHFDY
ncbi:hypothetical protein FKG94_26385 [Exilibacterium tricleocarpae]|uniref:Uncharacterized protein n=1 Tax=Exilibacterium tricleocarpae TaxID=2591008 RepID=A0A545SPU1_9GAMM|nr:tetratricopeptide repeat protein [Exilibacterium tricleocarpae]TQV66999.1 hypothetical protein FKG94_26385 [Exilibacterium tricleocarpae]